MKKVSYAKLALSLILASSVLVGCGKGTNSVSAQIIPSSQPSPATVEKSPELQSDIDKAFDELKKEQQKFLDALKGAITINDKKKLEIIKSDAVSTKIENLQTKIKEYRQNQLSKLQGEEKTTIEKILGDIDSSLEEISQKVINPFEEGFNRDSIENVQKNLGFFETRNISPDNYGNFGKTTVEEITKFLQDKQKSLEYDIQKLNSLDSDRSLPKSIVDFKKEFLIVATLALLASGIYWLKFRRKSNSNFFILKLLTNRQNPNNKWFNKFNLWTRNIHKDDQEKNINDASNQVDIQSVNNNQIEDNNNFYEKIPQNTADNDQISTEEIRKLKKRIEDLESCLQETENVEVREQTEQTDVTTWQPSELPDSQTSPSPEPSNSNSSNSSNSSGLDSYHSDSRPSSLIEVYPTEESLANRLRGSREPTILESKRRGIYGVYLDGNYHCLVPSQYFRINQNNYKSVEDLFECQNYDPNYSDSYTVIRPAVVYPLADGKTWQLQLRGILEF
ncbi:MAG: hypothetical protein O9287_14770 [Microcystis sp. LE17-20D]|uniref:hypothetical protein n=1 Tax=Microcystis sp. TaxID=1127 RepID=UPI0022C3C124|nr:hypothetical protein [Microcystis sp. LE17-20D]MCZ8067163.1 hypothetical protein [Microcystis sp. LE17-20D]MCZ8273212.1 hypothetical protein [Microcystis sp. LE19-4.1E]